MTTRSAKDGTRIGSRESGVRKNPGYDLKQAGVLIISLSVEASFLTPDA